MDLLTYLHHSWPTLLRLTGEHLALVGSAVGMAIVIGVPLGILITRHHFLATPLLALATVVLTLPSIALFFTIETKGVSLRGKHTPGSDEALAEQSAT